MYILIMLSNFINTLYEVTDSKSISQNRLWELCLQGTRIILQLLTQHCGQMYW